MFQKHPSSLSNDEIMMIRNIMQRSNIDVSTEYIRETWHPLYRRHFLKHSLARAYDCRKGYYMYHQGLESEVDIPVILTDNSTVTYKKIGFMYYGVCVLCGCK